MSTFRGRRAVAAFLLAFFALALVGALTLAGAAARPAAADDAPASPDTTTTLASPDTTTTVAAPADPAPADPAPADPAPAQTTTTTATTAPAVTTTTVTRRSTTTTTVRVRPAAATTNGATAAAPAQAAGATAGATRPPAPTDTNTTDNPDASVTLKIPGTNGAPSQSLMIIVLITLLSVAPALLIMLTSFTRIVIVLSLTRNALGLHTIPPNQVVVGLAMFLSFFVMSPTLSDINTNAVQPFLHGQKTQAQAYDAAVTPLRTFMLKQTRKDELSLFASAAASAGGKKPAKPEDVSLSALIPAFILSELKTAFIIGFVVFIPFLVIDIVVSSSLMSMGMMMLPPALVSLPFKILLFVMVDGWGLIVRSLLKSFG
jgi:flagellar biosynthesis protein FliP